MDALCAFFPGLWPCIPKRGLRPSRATSRSVRRGAQLLRLSYRRRDPRARDGSGSWWDDLNAAETDTDFTWFNIDGDFSASGYTLLDFDLVDRRLMVDFGAYDFDVSQVSYHRGIDSDPDDYILPHAKGAYLLGQLTWTFDERRYETYLRLLDGDSRLVDVSDPEGNFFAAVDTPRPHLYPGREHRSDR